MTARDPGGKWRERQPCGLCDGTGFCALCDGNGRYPNSDNGFLVACALCPGSGACRECHGTGMVPAGWRGAMADGGRSMSAELKTHAGSSTAAAVGAAVAGQGMKGYGYDDIRSVA